MAKIKRNGNIGFKRNIRVKDRKFSEKSIKGAAFNE